MIYNIPFDVNYLHSILMQTCLPHLSYALCVFYVDVTLASTYRLRDVNKIFLITYLLSMAVAIIWVLTSNGE